MSYILVININYLMSRLYLTFIYSYLKVSFKVSLNVISLEINTVYPVFSWSPYFRGFRVWTFVRENNMTVKSANTVVLLRLNLKSAKI